MKRLSWLKNQILILSGLYKEIPFSEDKIDSFNEISKGIKVDDISEDNLEELIKLSNTYCSLKVEKHLSFICKIAIAILVTNILIFELLIMISMYFL